MSNTKTTLGFIAGISIGAIAGILLAPDSGAATRKKIIDASGDLAASVKDTVTGLLSKAETDIKQEANEVVQNTSEGETRIRQLMHNVKEGIA